MAPSGGAQVVGLRDFQRSVKRASSETSKQLKREMKAEVAEPVARTIRGNVPVDSGRWQRSIKAGSTTRGAHVVWGRSQVPYAGWLEFGGQLPSRRSGQPPRVQRTRVSSGRYVWPEIGRARNTAEQAAEQVLQRAFQQARLDIRSGASL